MKRQGWMTAEEWLALLLCRLQIHENIENEIRKVIENETVDTAKLQWICKEQRICPQLEYAILTTELSSLYTKEELIMTEKEHCLHDLRYLKYEQEISRIQSVLDTAGIRMVVFKGISYYGTIYPSRRQRVLGDIDIVVAKTDIIKTVRCLESAGYEATGKTVGWSDQQYEAEAERCIHTAQLIGKNGIELELHTPAFFYTGYSLQTAYERAVTQRAGIRIPVLQDQFWIACVHSWHHFPLRKNPLRTHFCMLGYLLDVYAGYERMKQEYTAERIMEMADVYDISDVVRFMVYAAYHVLDPERNPMQLHKSEKAVLDWKYGGLELTLERRYLRSEECAGVMEQQFECMKRVIEIGYFHDEELPYRLEVCFHDPAQRWPVNILETGSPENPGSYIAFQIAWTMDAFILRWKPVGKIIWRCKNENYDAHLSHVMLRIGAVYEEEPLNILFQCCDGHLYPYMAPENNPWDHNGYVVPEIRCECNDRGIYTCYIPWSVLKFKAEHNQLLYIDLQARMVTVREQRYVDVCWQAGNCGCMWQEVRDCRFLTPAVLQ